ncbi:MAG: hypothetical protein U5J95_03935 [Balneolaceae bacterium]|nr:hypothetical protein [Balneolaceae bacterium]
MTKNQGHVQSGEVINLETLKKDMKLDSSYALVKTPDMEVIRMALKKGKVVTENSVSGEISIQCLTGSIEFKVGDQVRSLTHGDWIYLQKKQVYSYTVNEDTILLVTILFTDDEE